MKSTDTCENNVNDNDNFNNNCFYLYEYIQFGYIMNIIKNYNLKEAFNILLSNLLINNAFPSCGIKMGKDLGIKDEDFLIGLGIINRINKNENIILKIFNFCPRGMFKDNYF